MFFGFSGIADLKTITEGLKPVAGPIRGLFFLLTFTSIGIVTDFKKLKKEG